MSLDVLVVEDNALNCELAHDLLVGEGHRVTIVADCAGCRAALEWGAPADVILMDILLPDGDGVSLRAELEEDGLLEGRTVIALTAQALIGDAERFLAAGFHGVITKPIDTRRFVASIERLCAGRLGERG